MIQYLVILLDDTSVSFCHYANSKNQRKLISLQALKNGILYAMKLNLSVQFVYPDYDLPKEYLDVMDSIDHTDIKSIAFADTADVVVVDGYSQILETPFRKGISYVLRIDRGELFCHVDDISSVLDKVTRLNIVVTDVENFAEIDFKCYSEVLQLLSQKIEQLCILGHMVQLNLLTDRIILDNMNNCGAGNLSITLAPDGKFYICPAFYFSDEVDGIGLLKFSVGDVMHGVNIKNYQLFNIDHAPLCSHCDAYQCKRCIWLNRKMTYEVNTPSHEQCVMAHLERNASRELLISIRKHGTFLPEQDDIPKIEYLDPIDVRKNLEYNN